jgi:anti-sigma regulatory factor (Ser/Thr protein kinase)
MPNSRKHAPRREADMGRQASAQAAQPGDDSGPREPPDPGSAPAMPARTQPAIAPRCAPLKAPEPAAPRTAAPPGHYASIQLDPHPAAASRARQLTRDCLTRWHMPDALTDDAQVIASEIVTNALAAVLPTTAGLTILYAIHARTPSQLRISVWDIGPGQPVRTDAGPNAVTGRGLALIDALTNSNWGWWPTPKSGGKVVYATLTTDARETPA